MPPRRTYIVHGLRSYPQESNETLEEEDTSAGLEAKDGAGNGTDDPDEIEDDLDDFDDDDVRDLTRAGHIYAHVHMKSACLNTCGGLAAD